MKRIGFLYPKIYDVNNIKTAIYHASKDKNNHRYVKKVLENEDFYAYQIHGMLKNKNFRPSRPIIKTIKDSSSGKTRTIHKPDFYPDQIVHWALMLQLQPIIMKGMYKYNCGSVPKRGTTYGQETIRRWLDTDKKHTKYCLQMDISKFYPSIDNETLKKMFRRKIKDKDCLWLIDLIINSNQGQPIGYYTSQWFANFYLEGLDHYIKESLGVKYYVRYIDDLVMFGNNKKKLHRARKGITSYLFEIKLSVKGNWQVYPVDKRDIDFLGVRFYRNKTTLRRRNALRIKRRTKKISKKDRLSVYDAQAVVSYWGWIKRTDSYLFYHKHIKPYVTINEAKKVISQHARKNNQNGAG